MFENFGTTLVRISGTEKTIDELYRFMGDFILPPPAQWPGLNMKLIAHLHLSPWPLMVHESRHDGGGHPFVVLLSLRRASPTEMSMELGVDNTPSDSLLKFALIASGKWDASLVVKSATIAENGIVIAGNDLGLMAEAALRTPSLLTYQVLLAVLADCWDPATYDPATERNRMLVREAKSRGARIAAMDLPALCFKAGQGDAEAQHMLAMPRELYDFDYAAAEFWDRLAAGQGNPAAQFHLADLLDNTGSCESERWLRLAAEQGLAEAQCALARLYERDDSPTGRDESLAAAWYRRAAKQGNKTAQFFLACMCESGRGVSQNYAEAMRWYRAAADLEDMDLKNEANTAYDETPPWYDSRLFMACAGLHALGRMYEEGIGVERDYDEAVKWYRRAAAKGDAWANYSLGRMHEQGLGVPQDCEKAADFYRLAARNKFALQKARQALAEMYKSGRGVPQNELAAVYWQFQATHKCKNFATYLDLLLLNLEKEQREFTGGVEEIQDEPMSDEAREKLDGLRRKGQSLCEQSKACGEAIDEEQQKPPQGQPCSGEGSGLARMLAEMERLRQAWAGTNRELTELRAEVKAGHAETMTALRELVAAADEIRGCQRRAAELLEQQSLSLEKQEQILAKLTDDITEKVSETMSRMANGDKRRAQEKFERELQGTFGDDWPRLMPQSQRFLVTAKVLFDYQQGHTADLDYSGVCLLAVKALEGELRKRLFDGYKAYMEEKYPFRQSAQAWPECLLYKPRYGKPRMNTQFSLGAAPVICGARGDKPLLPLDAQRLDEYARDKLLRTGMDKAERQEALEYIGRNSDAIREKYRNPAAHINALQGDEAHKCLDFLLDVERALVKMMRMFR